MEALWWRANCSRVSRTWTHVRYITSTASRLTPESHKIQVLFSRVDIFTLEVLCILSIYYEI